MYNPLRIVGAHRRRRIGGEFFTCPDGSQVKNDAAGRALCGPPPSTSIPTNTGGWGPGPAIPPPTDLPHNTPTYTPPPGGSGGPGPGTPWNPPGGNGGPGPGTPWNPPGTPSGCLPVQAVCPENLKRYWMPFTPGAGFTIAVPAGSTYEFIGKPQKPFKGDRLIIGSGIAPYFDVVSLLIANIPQSLGSGAVPADMFSEVSTYTEMTFDPAGPGIEIVLSVKNKSSVTQNFQASLTGIAIG